MSMHFLKVSPRIVYTILAKHLHQKKKKNLNPHNIWGPCTTMVTGMKTLPQQEFERAWFVEQSKGAKAKAEGKQRSRKGNKHSEGKTHIHKKWIR